MEKIMFTWWNLQRYLKSEKGQGMVEYGLILSLVTLGAIVGLTSIGDKIAPMFNKVANGIK